MTIQCSVSSNLKNILDKKEISIREFSELCNISFESIRKYYNNSNKHFNKETLAVICEVLEIGIEDLLILDTKEHNN